MAVYEGARPRTFELPRRRVTSLPDRRTPPRARRRSRARRGSSPVGLSLAAILTTFLLGLFYLTQTIHVAATNYDVDTLLEKRNRLGQELTSLEADIARWAAEPAVVKGATAAGQSRLGRPLRVPAR
ncbi:MAG TPA: hypothetical protein VFK38_06500 [Candidatus Limnocylindrales bacterium]|nr:hypothetical protein [Candidatus Limnocylindrales bacterium]